jgi:hypothetical protein
MIAYPAPIGLDEARTAALGEGEILLSYFVGREHAMLWVVDRDGARFQRLAVSPSEIERRVDRFVRTAGEPAASLDGRAPGEGEAEALARMLLPDALPERRRLLVAPDGPLHHLPFAALRPRGRALIEDHEVVVVPSATALELMRRSMAPIAAEGFLGLGAPVAVGADPAFRALPHAREGLERLAALFPEEGRALAVGAGFTRKGLRELPLERYRYVHVATHGWLDAVDPRHFGLVLSPSGNEGGSDLLSLRDVLGLRLRAELVVLSACRSGQGELVRGEGLVSMTRAFLHAGARSVLVSLWDLDDRSTADFMELLHAELRRGLGTAQALRRAQLAFLGSDRPARRHAYRWAPFVLIGDPGPAAATYDDQGDAAVGATRAGGAHDVH